MPLLDLFRRPSNMLEAASYTSPWADPDALTQITLAHLYEGNSDVIPVSRTTAMGIAPLAKVRHLACGTISRFPLVAWAGNEAVTRPTQIVYQPERGRPAVVTWSWVVDALLWFGRAWFIVLERGTDNRPTVVEFVPEWRATVTSAGVLVQGNDRPVKPESVLRIDGPHEGLLNFAQRGIREAVDIDNAAANAALNPVPAIELHQTGGPEMEDEAIDKLTARWTRSRRKRGGGVAYTNPSIETKVHGQQPEQLLIAGRNMAALNVVRSAGFPAWAADVDTTGTSLTYSNAPSRSRELVDYALAPYMAAIEGRWSMDDVTPHGWSVRFDTSALLRADFAAQVETAVKAIEAGLYTAPEMRTFIETGSFREGTA